MACNELKIRESRLVIQIVQESLHKLETRIIYDAVSIKEWESVLKQLSSTTMTQTKNVYDNILIINFFMKHMKKYYKRL